jgi:hypothetical protein
MESEKGGEPLSPGVAEEWPYGTRAWKVILGSYLVVAGLGVLMLTLFLLSDRPEKRYRFSHGGSGLVGQSAGS